MSEQQPEPGGEAQEPERQTVVRHEAQLRVTPEERESGAVRVRKEVETHPAETTVPRSVEQADIQRVPAEAGDSGQIETLPDGSVSIPLLEEQLVVSKRTVVRERIIIRRRTVTEQQQIQAELRRERVDIEATPGAEVTVDESPG